MPKQTAMADYQREALKDFFEKYSLEDFEIQLWLFLKAAMTSKNGRMTREDILFLYEHLKEMVPVVHELYREPKKSRATA